MQGIALVQMLQRERRTGTVAQQPFESGPVGTLDAHRAIDRKTAVVRPSAHLGCIIAVDQAALGEGAQGTGSHAGKRRRVKFVGTGGMESDARRIIPCDGRLECPVDDATVEVAVLVQAGAETVDQGERPDPCAGGASGALFAQAAFHHGEENAQQRALQRRAR